MVTKNRVKRNNLILHQYQKINKCQVGLKEKNSATRESLRS